MSANPISFPSMESYLSMFYPNLSLGEREVFVRMIQAQDAEFLQVQSERRKT